MKVLFTTGYGRNAAARQEQIATGSAFISKPYPSRAWRELRRVLESS